MIFLLHRDVLVASQFPLELLTPAVSCRRKRGQASSAKRVSHVDASWITLEFGKEFRLAALSRQQEVGLSAGGCWGYVVLIKPKQYYNQASYNRTAPSRPIMRVFLGWSQQPLALTKAHILG